MTNLNSNLSSHKEKSLDQNTINNKTLSKVLRNDPLCLPSPRLNKRYRFSILPSNEELNNKIDLEIRILDGILKLLNAICSTTNLVSNSAQSNLNGINSSSNQTANNQSASSIINSLEAAKFEDINQCSTIGAQIAAAVISNKVSLNEINQLTSENTAFDTSSPEYNHVIQILTACKCLFVSHRKIAIYLQNLHELEKKSLDKSKNSIEIIHDEVENMDTKVSNNNINQIQSSLDTSSRTSHNISDNINTSLNIETCKLTLSDIRIPLSWKWTDYLKASKNSENVNCKFATFAVIYLGNMIYDTQLLSNIDASVTDINFPESFVFDDVKPNNFEIIIEIYAYELYNTANNILQSARKLAKQFTDFATFKRNGTHQSGSNHQNVLSQMPNLFNNALTNSTNTYSYSMHKFKLIAKASLNQNDLSENIETRCLSLVNDSSHDQINNSSISSSLISLNSQIQSNVSNISASNKLPLFDYYSCRLRHLPTTSYI